MQSCAVVSRDRVEQSFAEPTTLSTAFKRSELAAIGAVCRRTDHGARRITGLLHMLKYAVWLLCLPDTRAWNKTAFKS